MTMHLPQELRHVGRACVVVEQVVVQTEAFRPGSAGQRRQCRDAIVSVPRMLDGRPTHRSPHAPSQRLQQIATFVEKNQASLPFEALFLAAAIRRGATERWPVHCVRAPAAQASADSSRVCEAISARSLGGTPHQRAVGSCPAPAVRSSQMAHTPKIEFPASKRRPMRCVVEPRVSAAVRDGVWHIAHFHVATISSNDAPTKHSNPRTQPLPSTFSPAQKAGLRSCDELPALREFLRVSCPQSNESA